MHTRDQPDTSLDAWINRIFFLSLPSLPLRSSSLISFFSSFLPTPYSLRFNPPSLSLYLAPFKAKKPPFIVFESANVISDTTLGTRGNFPRQIFPIIVKIATVVQNCSGLFARRLGIGESSQYSFSDLRYVRFTVSLERARGIVLARNFVRFSPATIASIAREQPDAIRISAFLWSKIARDSGILERLYKKSSPRSNIRRWKRSSSTGSIDDQTTAPSPRGGKRRIP